WSEKPSRRAKAATSSPSSATRIPPRASSSPAWVRTTSRTAPITLSSTPRIHPRKQSRTNLSASPSATTLPSSSSTNTLPTASARLSASLTPQSPPSSRSPPRSILTTPRRTQFCNASAACSEPAEPFII
ncbi:Vacuolar-type H+-ATPase, Subunit V1-F, partial [Chondrus crispus]